VIEYLQNLYKVTIIPQNLEAQEAMMAAEIGMEDKATAEPTEALEDEMEVDNYDWIREDKTLF